MNNFGKVLGGFLLLLGVMAVVITVTVLFPSFIISTGIENITGFYTNIWDISSLLIAFYLIAFVVSTFSQGGKK